MCSTVNTRTIVSYNTQVVNRSFLFLPHTKFVTNLCKFLFLVLKKNPHNLWLKTFNFSPIFPFLKNLFLFLSLDDCILLWIFYLNRTSNVEESLIFFFLERILCPPSGNFILSISLTKREKEREELFSKRESFRHRCVTIFGGSGLIGLDVVVHEARQVYLVLRSSGETSVLISIHQVSEAGLNETVENEEDRDPSVSLLLSFPGT